LEETNSINSSLEEFSYSLTNYKLNNPQKIPRLPYESKKNAEIFLEFLKEEGSDKLNFPSDNNLFELKGVDSNNNNDTMKTVMLGVINTTDKTKYSDEHVKAIKDFHERKIVWSIREMLDNDIFSTYVENKSFYIKLFKSINPEIYALYDEYSKGLARPQQDFYGNDLETIYLTSVHSNISTTEENINKEPLKFTQIKRMGNGFFGGKNITKMDKINLELKNIKKLYKALK